MLCASITIDPDSELIVPMAVFSQNYSNITGFISHVRMLSAFTLIKCIIVTNYAFQSAP